MTFSAMGYATINIFRLGSTRQGNTTIIRPGATADVKLSIWIAKWLRFMGTGGATIMPPQQLGSHVLDFRAQEPAEVLLTSFGQFHLGLEFRPKAGVVRFPDSVDQRRIFRRDQAPVGPPVPPTCPPTNPDISLCSPRLPPLG